MISASCIAPSVKCHPVDELAQIRDSLAALQRREEELRQMILDGACGQWGENHVASVTTSVSGHVDATLLRKAFTADALAQYLILTKTTDVKLERLASAEPARLRTGGRGSNLERLPEESRPALVA